MLRFLIVVFIIYLIGANFPGLAKKLGLVF